MNDMLFDISETLCERYHGMTPFMVRKERCGEVFKVLFAILEKNRREKGIRKTDTIYTDTQGRTHIRRESTDDNFW